MRLTKILPSYSPSCCSKPLWLSFFCRLW